MFCAVISFNSTLCWLIDYSLPYFDLLQGIRLSSGIQTNNLEVSRVPRVCLYHSHWLNTRVYWIFFKILKTGNFVYFMVIGYIFQSVFLTPEINRSWLYFRLLSKPTWISCPSWLSPTTIQNQRLKWWKNWNMFKFLTLLFF